jgi:peptidase M23-like protein
VKLLAAPVAVLAAALLSIPVLFATGDPATACPAGGDLGPILSTIRTRESGGDYTARSAGSTASGAYQFIDTTWAGYDGYPLAWLAPPEVQDRRAAENVQRILDTHQGDVSAVPVIWYLGHLPADGSAEWDTVPGTANRLTPRQYQTEWLAEYDRQRTGPGDAPEGGGGCVPGIAIGALADGYAYPAPTELFATAPVDKPHHDYPAWDWPIPVGTPIYAVRGGTVTAAPYWPHNWWDRGCDTNSTACGACGIGVTITDDAGTTWTYCHGSAAHVGIGDTAPAGTQILTSGNTGRSTGAHLHLQVRTPDGALRCPQRLLRSLRDNAAGLDPSTLPTSGCTY